MPDVNDVQSQLNPTKVHSVVKPQSVAEIQAVLAESRNQDRAVSISGGRHAMGGQQFGADTVLIDLQEFNQVIGIEQEKGLITVESGLEWPELIEYLHKAQSGNPNPWAIRQKQTGVDRVSIGGSLAANVHGRGLNLPPFVSDVESFEVLNAEGKLLTCSRQENQELFSLVAGGYGLFGVVTQVTLRLVPRVKVKRLVEVIAVRGLLSRVEECRQEGFIYGDCQYSINLNADAEFHPGVFSCYKPVEDDSPVPEQHQQLSPGDWAALYTLARSDKQKAFEKYSQYYLGTSGRIYWSDTHQLSNAFEGYSEVVDKELGTELITEVYVNQDAFIPFLAEVRNDFVQHQVDMTYGTIRFIQRDEESFLAWAKESYVCIVCNLHVMHTAEGIKKARENFCRIIDRTIEFGGNFYLTYHRFATRLQLETCYPQLPKFLDLKKKYDPQERFQSDWYRHIKQLFADNS